MSCRACGREHASKGRRKRCAITECGTSPSQNGDSRGAGWSGKGGVFRPGFVQKLPSQIPGQGQDGRRLALAPPTFEPHGRVGVGRAIRPLCLSRKNALFASGDDGGSRWAAVASLIETCKMNGVDPQRYFSDVLTRLVNGWPQSHIDELMPWHWAPTKNS